MLCESMKRQIVSRAFYGCKCRTPVFLSPSLSVHLVSGSWGVSPKFLSPWSPQGLPIAAICPRYECTCLLWWITQSSCQTSPQMLQKAWPKRCGANIRRTRRWRLNDVKQTKKPLKDGLSKHLTKWHLCWWHHVSLWHRIVSRGSEGELCGSLWCWVAQTKGFGMVQPAGAWA